VPYAPGLPRSLPGRSAWRFFPPLAAFNGCEVPSIPTAWLWAGQFGLAIRPHPGTGPDKWSSGQLRYGEMSEARWKGRTHIVGCT